MTLMLRLCLFTFIYLTVTDCRLLPVTKPQARREYEKKYAQVLPEAFMKNSKTLINNIIVPNIEFCTDMILKPEDHYLVLPWWYNYCQDLKEKDGKAMQGNVNYNEIHKYMLAEVQLYKKRLNGQHIKMSELEKELAAFNHAK